MRIIYCINSVYLQGGIERITIAKANALSQVEGNEVWIAVADNGYSPQMPLSQNVHLVDLGVNYYQGNSGKNKFQMLWLLLKKQMKHRKRLGDLFRDIRPDIVVSTSNLEKNVLPFVRYRGAVVYIKEMHLLKSHRWFVAATPYERLIARMGDLLDYHLFIHKYDRVVVLTEEDRETNWGGNDKVIVIPNPLTISHGRKSSLTNKTVISVGRLGLHKNQTSLIRAWSVIHGVHPDWKLELWGSGDARGQLEKQIAAANLTGSVMLMGSSNDIISKMAEASIYVCSSLFEGFGLVITEAMSCGLPVVSYDCPCGPKDIITDGKDGFLVPVGDEKMLADRICYLIEHEEERRAMGATALEKSKQYGIDSIVRRWMSMFQELVA